MIGWSEDDIQEIERIDTEHGVYYFRVDVSWLLRAFKYLKSFFVVGFLVLLPTLAHAWTTAEFNFRATSGYVADGTDETYVTGDTYPTTRATFTFGWTTSLSDGTRDRDNSVDRRLAGVNKTANTSQKDFKVDLPATGNYTICLALGDATNDYTTGPQYVQILDNTTPLFTINDTGGTVGGHFDDATGVDRTSAAWPGSNACRVETFTTTTLILRLGDGSGADQSSIAHLSITAGGTPTTTTTTTSTTTTTLPPGPYATIEDICPGGASPRSDIQWCQNYENLDNCITGQEAQCAIDNYATDLTASDSSGLKIRTCPVTPAVGSGCVYGSGPKSGSGPGYISKTISGSPTSVNLRWYVRFDDGWMQNQSDTGNHGPDIFFTDGASCSGSVALDWTHKDFRAILAITGSTCGGHNPEGGNLIWTASDFSPQNGKWYLVEMRVTLNTSATGTAKDTGNGVVKVWVDGTEILSYTNVNLRGDSTTAKINNAFTARSYLGLGTPRWQPKIYYDAFVLSSDGTYIGPSGNANVLGSVDPLSPYWYAAAGDGMEQSKLDNDCSAPGSATKYVSTGWQDDWGVGKSFVTTPDNNSYACNSTACPSCTTTNSMKATTAAANAGAGVYYPLYGVGPLDSRVVLHQAMYLPSANSYAVVFPLSGFARYCTGGGGGNDRCYAGIAVKSDHWSVALKKDNVAGTTHESATTVTYDAWHDVELHLTIDNKISLYVDGVAVIDNVTANQNVDWIFDDTSTGGQFAVVGIIKSEAHSSSFSTYNDDADVGAASFINCTGWTQSVCPLAAPLTSTGSNGTSRVFNFIKRKGR